MQLFTSPPPSSRMSQVIVRKDKPAYLVGAEKLFIDNRLYEKGSPIILEGTPNPHLIPLNKLAFERMKKYMEELDTHGKAWAKENRKYYVPQVNAFVNKYGHLAAAEGGAVNLAESDVPIFSGKERSEPKASMIPFNTAAFIEPEVVGSEAA